MTANSPASREDSRWLSAAAALAGRGRPVSRPNPAVGAIMTRDGTVLARGWTQAGGRPHAEAIALEQAGSAAKGATLYVSLEPCAHESARGPDCTGSIIAAGIGHVVVGVEDPDHRTAGSGIARLRDAGIRVTLADDAACRASLAGYLTMREAGRPFVTLKLATSLDGCIALADGTSRWITGAEARAHAHLERARSDAILVGGGTLRADDPQLDVRLPGLEDRSPQRCVLTRGDVPGGWTGISSPAEISALEGMQYLLVEGGTETAASFLREDLVDRLLIYRAPIVIGGGRACIGNIGLSDLSSAHGRWRPAGRRQLGSDTLEVYERLR